MQRRRRNVRRGVTLSIDNMSTLSNTLNTGHLKLIKDVLKDGQFTDTVWYDLGLNLEISPNELDVIDKESNKDMSACLRKMLTLWLQSGNARPQLLANALDEMGNKTAAAKVRKILIDPASQILLSYKVEFTRLEKLSNDLISSLLNESLLTKGIQDKLSESGNLLVGEALRAVCIIVADDHNKLKILADVLSKFRETKSLGQKLLQDCDREKGNLFPEKKLIEPSQPSQTTVSSLEQSTQTLASSPGTSSDCQLNYSNEASIDQAALKLTSSVNKEISQSTFVPKQNEPSETLVPDEPISFQYPEDKIHAYQKELARPGLEGKNYIICAPTGSGKTLVAALIIYDHLDKIRQRGLKGKVLFIVSTQQLARQQNLRLREYISGIKVVDITGDTDCPIHSTLPQVDIIVCTAGKLCGELYHKLIRIFDATLLVLDECHHTSGRSPYAEVMEYYLLDKREGRRMPHVIGMTASPGAGRGRFPGIGKAIHHQLKLCARIDATGGIKCVQENIEELKSVVPSATSRSHPLPPRSHNEEFIQVISKVMEDLEQRLPEKSNCSFDRFSQSYQQWIKNEIEAAQLNQMDNQRDQINVLELLEFYHLALITYADFEIENAKEILDGKQFDDESVLNEMEKYLKQVHEKVMNTVGHIRGQRNSLLYEAEHLLLNHFSSKPDSKALFFVRAVDHTQYVTQWIERNSDLKHFIRPCSITGHSRKGNMSKAEQLKVIDNFRSGKYNLLATTSVLEEGLDVPECNMVIRFQIMSNEVSDVQAQGRARAEDSTLHTIITSDSPVHHRELINNDKKEQANRAVEYISKEDSIDLASIAMLQKEILDQREQRIKEEQERKHTWNAEDVDLLCCKCGVVACNAAEICKFGKIGSVVVPSQSFISDKIRKFSRKKEEPKPVGGCSRPYKIACINCNEEWGAWGSWENGCVQYPLLLCKKFVFRNNKTSECQKGRQWKSVPFEVIFHTEFEENDV